MKMLSAFEEKADNCLLDLASIPTPKARRSFQLRLFRCLDR